MLQEAFENPVMTALAARSKIGGINKGLIFETPKYKILSDGTVPLILLDSPFIEI
jgi:hypothetical protein